VTINSRVSRVGKDEEEARVARVAIVVRAMEKFAALGVDAVGIAHSQKAAATNRDTFNVGPGRLARWHLSGLG
jgi:hypothetical protein